MVSGATPDAGFTGLRLTPDTHAFGAHRNARNNPGKSNNPSFPRKNPSFPRRRESSHHNPVKPSIKSGVASFVVSGATPDASFTGLRPLPDKRPFRTCAKTHSRQVSPAICGNDREGGNKKAKTRIKNNRRVANAELAYFTGSHPSSQTRTPTEPTGMPEIIPENPTTRHSREKTRHSREGTRHSREGGNPEIIPENPTTRHPREKTHHSREGGNPEIIPGNPTTRHSREGGNPVIITRRSQALRAVWQALWCPATPDAGFTGLRPHPRHPPSQNPRKNPLPQISPAICGNDREGENEEGKTRTGNDEPKTTGRSPTRNYSLTTLTTLTVRRFLGPLTSNTTFPGAVANKV